MAFLLPALAAAAWAAETRAAAAEKEEEEDVVMCRPVSKFTHTLTKLTDYFLILFLVRDETDCVMQ